MIDTIIFDFGDILINLNKTECNKAFEKLGLSLPNTEVLQLNDAFETGSITETEFLNGLQILLPTQQLAAIKAAWNAIIGDFPLYRLEFLKLLQSKYRLFLLSNTDKMHIWHFEEKVGADFSAAFYQCFEKVYFSFDMKLRKPNKAIYEQVIKNHNLNPQKTLFIDDKKENTDAALQCGLHIWNLQVGQEDVVEIFQKNIL